MRRSRRCRDGQSSTILRGEEEGVEAKDEHRVSHFFGGWLWDVGCAFAMWELKERLDEEQAVQPATKCKEDTVLSS